MITPFGSFHAYAAKKLIGVTALVLLSGFVNAQTEQVPSPALKAEPPKFQTWYKVPEEHKPKIPGRLVNFVMDHPNVPVKGSIFYNADFSERALAYENPEGQPDGFGVWFCADLRTSNPNRLMFLRDGKGKDFLFYSYDAIKKWGNVVNRYSEPFMVKEGSIYKTEFTMSDGFMVKAKYVFSPDQIKFEWINRPTDRFPYIYKVMTRENCKDY